MKFQTDLITHLTGELKKPLPGEKIRHRLSPPYRPQLSAEEIQNNQPKLGGVLILLYEKGNEWHIVFTERKAYDGVHSGQMSLPGGKKDDSDKDLVHTALRETEEEIGVAASTIQVLGKLSELYIPPSNFLVYPSVGFSQGPIAFHPQQDEVERIVEIPAGFFLDEHNIDSQRRIQLYNGTTVVVPAYIYGQHVIWGATAIIMSEFVHLMQQVIKSR